MGVFPRRRRRGSIEATRTGSTSGAGRAGSRGVHGHRFRTFAIVRSPARLSLEHCGEVVTWERFLDEVWTYERLPNRAHGGHPCAATPAQARSRCRSPRVDPDRPRSRLPVRDLM